LIKGGGGALLREKVLAYNSKQFIVIVDESKSVEHLGKYHLPVEIIPFAMELTLKQIQKLDCITKQRFENDKPYITDNGNYIIDCDFTKIDQVDRLHQSSNAIPGVVENGLFPEQMVNKVIIGYQNGEIKTITND